VTGSEKSRGASEEAAHGRVPSQRPFTESPAGRFYGLAEGPTGVAVWQSLARSNLDLQRASPTIRYGFSAVSVAIGAGAALALHHYGFRNVELPLLSLAIVVTTWYVGLGPSVLAVVLSTACFDYFFAEPIHSFEVSRRDLPYFLLFIAWAAITAWFVDARHRIESDLRNTRDHLQREVEQRKRREDEIRDLNKELAKRASELETSNNELESFAYSVSHDLRAPLRHVVGYSELLQKHASSSLDEKSRRYMQTILESAKRMGNLIDDLLAFSGIGRAETRMTLVSLDLLVKEVVTEIGHDTGGRDIVWKIDPPPVCYGDRAMLRLVIVNLLSNAVKFTRMRAQAEIEIGSVDAEDHVEVFVRDNGAGFDMQYVNKLFGVFQRLHLPEQFEGTGIGLATVRRVIHRHGGEVRAEGAVDQGATIYFSLPKTQDAAERTANTP
jgi:signal transduction histidine kinase